MNPTLSSLESANQVSKCRFLERDKVDISDALTLRNVQSSECE